MFSTSIIEVVIGLIFVFSLLAILVTQVNGIITTVLNLRARHLKAGLVELVTDKKIRAKLLGHPIINMVQTTVVTDAQLSAQQAEDIARIKETKVSYIPAQTFIEALIGILISESDNDLFAPLQRAVREIKNSPGKSKLRELIGSVSCVFSEAKLREIYQAASSLDDSADTDTMLKGLNDVEESLQGLYLRSEELIPIMKGISRIDDDRFRNALRTVLVSARNLDEARTKLETWFDDNMSRVTDKFKREMQRYSIVVALTMCLVLNIDSLFLARTLWEDDTLRASVAQTARDFEQPAADNAGAGAALPGGETTILVTEETGGGTGTNGDATVEQLQQQTQEAQQSLQTLLDLQLPIGWQYSTVTDVMVQQSLDVGLTDPRNNTRNLWNFIPGHTDHWFSLWIRKIIGIIVTTVAAAQGAPFWFDLLNRLTRR